MARTIHLLLTVNGVKRDAQVPPMKRLLDVLREDLALTGAKEGCGEGECGACAVLLNGELINTCLVPAFQAQGASITTIEGLATASQLNPVQAAFLEGGGAQCGICTPGMVMAAMDLLRRCPEPTEAQIREGLAGNLCRCTGYVKIVDSVQEASRRALALPEGGSGSQSEATRSARSARYPEVP